MLYLIYGILISNLKYHEILFQIKINIHVKIIIYVMKINQTKSNYFKESRIVISLSVRFSESLFQIQKKLLLHSDIISQVK